MKQGKDISVFEIRKRLNIMGVSYDSEQMSKEYFVNLYDEAIQDETKRKKIESDLENDLIYSTKRRKNTIYKIQNAELFNIKNNFEYEAIESNDSNSEFLSLSFKETTILLHLGFNVIKPVYDKNPAVKKYIQKILFPIQAAKKYATLRLIPFLKDSINDFIDKISKIDLDINHIYIILCFILLFFVFISFAYKLYRRKKMNEKIVVE